VPGAPGNHRQQWPRSADFACCSLPLAVSTSPCSTGSAVAGRVAAPRLRVHRPQHRPVIPFLAEAVAASPGERWPQRQQPQQDHNGQRNTRQDQNNLQGRHAVTVTTLPPPPPHQIGDAGAPRPSAFLIKIDLPVGSRAIAVLSACGWRTKIGSFLCRSSRDPVKIRYKSRHPTLANVDHHHPTYPQATDCPDGRSRDRRCQSGATSANAPLPRHNLPRRRADLRDGWPKRQARHRVGGE
jgi:hypothetical protein